MRRTNKAWIPPSGQRDLCNKHNLLKWREVFTSKWNVNFTVKIQRLPASLVWSAPRASLVHTKMNTVAKLKKRGRRLTLFMYSLNKSWRAWRTALHSATMRSRRSSRVHEESAINAAPLMMLSKRSSREGRKRASLNVRGSRMILFCRVKMKKVRTGNQAKPG